MVPLAVGTQTGGSVIRPAAFCGVVGFKPSFGAIPRTGVLAQSPSLDTVGVFARSVADAALVAEALYGHDPGDRGDRPGAAAAPASRPRSSRRRCRRSSPSSGRRAGTTPTRDPGRDGGAGRRRSASGASRPSCRAPSPRPRRSASGSTSPRWRNATTATNAGDASALAEVTLGGDRRRQGDPRRATTSPRSTGRTC